MKKQRNIHRSEHDWRTILQTFSQSGLTQAEFYRQKNINLRHFYAWKSRLQPLTSAASGSPAFIELSSGVTTGEPYPFILSRHSHQEQSA